MAAHGPACSEQVAAGSRKPRRAVDRWLRLPWPRTRSGGGGSASKVKASVRGRINGDSRVEPSSLDLREGPLGVAGGQVWVMVDAGQAGLL